MSRPWMPLYIADYIKDTRRLSLQEHGAYLLLIFEYWTAGSLPNDEKQLARIIGANSQQWNRVKPAISAFFTAEWKHKRIDAELAKSQQISIKRSASAKLMHSKSSANAEHVHTQLQSQRKKEPPPAASGDVELYRRGREILGEEAGGMVKKLLTAKDGSIPLARAALELASTKSKPREYLGGVLRGAVKEQDTFNDPMAGVL